MIIFFDTSIRKWVVSDFGLEAVDVDLFKARDILLQMEKHNDLHKVVLSLLGRPQARI
jgi:hypothetical protein